MYYIRTTHSKVSKGCRLQGQGLPHPDLGQKVRRKSVSIGKTNNLEGRMHCMGYGRRVLYSMIPDTNEKKM